MRTKSKSLLLYVIFFSVSFASDTELDAINKLIDNYARTEDSGRLIDQAKMMSEDRIWIGANGAGRITDQAYNMNMQQSQADAMLNTFKGIEWFTDTRDRLIKIFGDGQFAVASFYWYRTFILPSSLDAKKRNMMQKQPDPAAITLVLEKRSGSWKIVHTHSSSLVKRNDLTDNKSFDMQLTTAGFAKDTYSENVANQVSNLDDFQEAMQYLGNQLHQYNILNSKLLLTDKLFKEFALSNEQRQIIVETLIDIEMEKFLEKHLEKL